MTRLGAVFWGGLVLASGFATFNVKYAVQGIEEELARVRRQTVAEQQEVRVLAAEWAYLNQPERLAELNRSFLQLAPMTTKQLQGRVDEIALRAPPVEAPAAPATMVAGNSPEAAPSVARLPAAMLAATTSSAPPAAAHGADGKTAEASPAATVPGAARAAATAPDAPAALAEALHVLGADAAGQTPPARLAKADQAAATQIAATQPAPAQIAPAQTTDARDANAGDAEAQSAAAAPAGARNAGAASDAAAALAEALHVLGVNTGTVDAVAQRPRVQIAKASPTSLDALISKITNSR